MAAREAFRVASWHFHCTGLQSQNLLKSGLIRGWLQHRRVTVTVPDEINEATKYISFCPETFS